MGCFRLGSVLIPEPSSASKGMPVCQLGEQGCTFVEAKKSGPKATGEPGAGKPKPGPVPGSVPGPGTANPKKVQKPKAKGKSKAKAAKA